MSKKDPNGPEPPSNGLPEPPPNIEDLSPAEVQRLVAEAQARGEDPLPIVRRAVLSTIDALAKKVPRTPDDDA